MRRRSLVPLVLLTLGAALVGASLLEVVNYLEHYGLVRERLPNGRYERRWRCATRSPT